jgi:hypothetical protein
LPVIIDLANPLLKVYSSTLFSLITTALESPLSPYNALYIVSFNTLALIRHAVVLVPASALAYVKSSGVFIKSP